MEFVEIAGTEINSSRVGLGTWAMGGMALGRKRQEGMRENDIQGV